MPLIQLFSADAGEYRCPARFTKEAGCDIMNAPDDSILSGECNERRGRRFHMNYYEKLDYDFSVMKGSRTEFPAHYHEKTEILLVRRGICEMLIGDTV